MPPPDSRFTPARLLALFLTVLAAFGVGGLTVSLVDSDGDGHKDSVKVSVEKIHVDGVDADKKADDTITVPTAAVKEAAAVTENHLKDETPEVAQIGAPEQLARMQEIKQEVRATKPALPVAGATQGFPGCRTSFVRNQSSRNGIRPVWITLHYTVSGNRPGWSDVNAIVALFNTSSSQVSAHFVIDGEGNCAYIVPIESKAWANAAGNSLSVNIEVINSGRESVYLAPAGQARLLSVERTISARTGIPLRAGNVYPARSGIVQHKDGGLAWGGHVDIGPYSISQQQKLAAAPSKPVKIAISSRDRSTCKAVAAYRARERQRNHPGGRNPPQTKKGTAAFKKRLTYEKSRGHKCVGGKPKQLR